jgi:hypothetical protein
MQQDCSDVCDDNHNDRSEDSSVLRSFTSNAEVGDRGSGKEDEEGRIKMCHTRSVLESRRGRKSLCG